METEKQGYLGKIENKSREELLELISRQNKLLQNKKLIATLADKGEKIKQRKKLLEDALAKCSDVSNIISMFSDLKIQNNPSPVQRFEVLDSDDDDDVYDGSEESASSNLVKENGVTEEILNEKPKDDSKTGLDLKTEDRGDGQTTHSAIPCSDNNIPNYFSLVTKQIDDKVKSKERFKPHKSLRKQREVHVKPNVDESSATPPPLVYGPVKIVSLTESYKLQQKQEVRLKELQVLNAAQRLAEKVNIKLGDEQLVISQTMNYRDKRTPDHDDDEIECEEEEEDLE